LEAARTGKTRALILAHTLGNPFDLDAVVSFARKHDLFLVEDCCDAFGATQKASDHPRSAHDPASQDGQEACCEANESASNQQRSEPRL
jgi:hypothetical protein